MSDVSASPRGRRLTIFIDRGVADLLPAYFALVMATGIVSLAAWIQGYAIIARAVPSNATGAYTLTVQ